MIHLYHPRIVDDDEHAYNKMEVVKFFEKAFGNYSCDWMF
uniref:Uncharacterized protein n=1 Tax=viral metagenome TaxID=1070528 RepID=A0A6C0CAH9_9ZZZZ